MEAQHSIRIQGFRINYVVKGQGQPLLFLHNGGTSHRIWEQQLDYFQSDYRVYAFDLPGFGASDKHRQRYSHAFYVEVLAEFIERLALAPLRLVGHCMGSSFALHYSLAQPSHVTKLVLFNLLTEQGLNQGKLGTLSKLGQRLPALTQMLSALSPYLPLPERIKQHAIRAQLQQPHRIKSDLMAHLHDLFRDKQQLRSLNEVVLDLANYRLEPSDQRRDTLPPLLMLWGASNRILPLSTGQHLANLLQPEQFAIIPDAGHLCMCEQPRRVNQLLADFLSSD